MDTIQLVLRTVGQTPLPTLGAIATSGLIVSILLVYVILYTVAPIPRAPLPSEKTFTFVTEAGSTRRHNQLPCWYDKYVAEQEAVRSSGGGGGGRGGRGGRGGEERDTETIGRRGVLVEPAEVLVSLVVPAFNEEERLGIMLTEAVAYLEQQYGTGPVSGTGGGEAEGRITAPEAHGNGNTPPLTSKTRKLKSKKGGKERSVSPNPTGGSVSASPNLVKTLSGYEILVVSDGSTDRTVETALAFARKQLPPTSRPNLRVVSLERNRGKGGAVTHGLRHVRGAYALFADADGATRFSDLGAVLEAARSVEQRQLRTAAAAAEGREKGGITSGTGAAVSVGSRAHMVNTPAVVKRSALRNLLMRGFHIFLKLMTPPKTARIGDTQCGFKLFSRGALPHIVPWMHSEGWIFDVEMLMLAESAGIDVAEVPVGWKEIGGSKLNVVWDSLGMAWGLAVLRGAWMLGVYRRRW